MTTPTRPGEALRQPDWIAQAVFYQVFPDRFRKADPALDPESVTPWGEAPGADGFALPVRSVVLLGARP
ncbi:MAG: hypothetical protein LBL55_08200 [Propionibacteriaceae bacterium]|jgi:hypothetical protein|nr:hypothetical protein [Propionibacteriaceae bacterium]